MLEFTSRPKIAHDKMFNKSKIRDFLLFYIHSIIIIYEYIPAYVFKIYILSCVGKERKK